MPNIGSYFQFWVWWLRVGSDRQLLRFHERDDTFNEKNVKKASWTVCSPMREKFRGKKGFEVLRISPRGLTQQGICYSFAGKLFSTHYPWFLTLYVVRSFLVLIWSKSHCFLMLVKQKKRKTKGKLVRVWTKRPTPWPRPWCRPWPTLWPTIGLPVIIFFKKTRLSIAVNLCKQHAPTTRKHVKPYSMK